MKTLREFAGFVDKPGQPISVRALATYLIPRETIPSISLRELLHVFGDITEPLRFDLVVEPLVGDVPFVIVMRLAGVNNPVLSGHYRVLRGGQQLAVHEWKLGELNQFQHDIREPGQYSIEATVRGIGKDGYTEIQRAATVTARQKPPLERPDLTWTTPQPTFNGTRLQIKFTNAGTKHSGAFRVGTLVNNIDTGEIVYTNIKPGEGDTVWIETKDLSPGDYTFNFTLDKYNTVDESNETNNASFGFFTIFPPSDTTPPTVTGSATPTSPTTEAQPLPPSAVAGSSHYPNTRQ